MKNLIRPLLGFRLYPVVLALFVTTVCGENELYEESDLPISKIRVGNPVKIDVSPSGFQFPGPRDPLQIVVTGHYANGETADLTRVASVKIANPGIAESFPRGVIKPIANGKTEAIVSVGGLQQKIQLSVEIPASSPVSFHRETLPLLSKLGCSMGACHGSPHGKGHFRLSLRAFDATLDEETIISEEFGRRINFIEPADSLLLVKPLNKIAHEGGQRLRESDDEYQLLLDWITSGCQVKKDDPACTGIQVTPGEARFLKRPHHIQQFRVIAAFEDGSTRDVTHLAVFESSDETVCKVSRHGLAVGLRRGEAAVIVRFLEHIESTLLSFVEDVPGMTWKAPEPKNYIDEHVYAKLKQFRYLPSETCSDSEFLRRVSLDLTGLLPSPGYAGYFLANDDPYKRQSLIEELLDSDEFEAFWAQKWGDILKLSARQMGHGGVLKFHHWIRTSVSENQPYDEFVREILLAKGSNLTTPTGNFYRSGSDTSDIMESTAQLFLGTRIGCAKCHNHPYERWTQDHYYGLSAFFNRIRTRKTGRKGEVVVWMDDQGEVHHPATNAIVRPWVPGSDGLELESDADRRETFVAWLTSKENPYFAKVEVNRIWTQLLGRGIVEPFDDFRDTNPPANQPLLEALTFDFMDHGFDRKHLIRTIMNSRTYQASSQPNQSNKEDTRFFSHYLPRRLTAEQLVDALGDLTDVRETFVSVPPGTKATQLPAPDLKPHDRSKLGEIEFLKVFGMPERQSVCECERGDDSSLGQALELYNGATVHRMISGPENRFRRLMKAGQPIQTILTELYYRAFSRPPEEREVAVAMKYLEGADNMEQALEDLVWAVINRDEFLFQH